MQRSASPRAAARFDSSTLCSSMACGLSASHAYGDKCSTGRQVRDSITRHRVRNGYDTTAAHPREASWRACVCQRGTLRASRARVYCAMARAQFSVRYASAPDANQAKGKIRIECDRRNETDRT